MEQPPEPGRQCGHHWAAGFAISLIPSSLQHNEQVPQLRFSSLSII
jgi:hypothetical protein